FFQVWEGSVTVITTKHLAVVDEDSVAQDLHFLLSSVKNGHVAIKDNTETVITNFTQVDINHEAVVYVHSDSKDVSSAGFYFQVTDGMNIGSRQFFAVSIKRISLKVVRKEKLYVFPKVKQIITAENLLVTTSDNNRNRPIRFNITTKPQLGRVLLRDANRDELVEVDSFTQLDVNSSALVYEHVKPFPDLTASDSFVFDIDCPLTSPLLQQELHMEISLLKINSDSLQQYVTTRDVRVKEGDRVVIEQGNLNTSRLAQVLSETDHLKFVPNIHMVITQVPRHGIFQLHGENGTLGASFTQSDVNEAKFVYVHDDSDTLRDSAVFTIYLDSSEFGGTDAVLLNTSLDFTIEPINDEKFELITKTPRVEVVRGQKVAITASNLKTVDPDTAPNEIRYDIITPPSSGRLRMKDEPEQPVQMFTQQDVDDGNLYYVHDGSENTVTFYFKVSDGVFRAVYRVFNIHVLPLSLKMVNNSLITLPQATTAVYLKSSNVGAYTNGNRSRLFYNVTTHPKHGMLLLHDESVSQFGQSDIDAERVIYMLVEKGVSEDSFTASVSIEEKVLKDETFHISVTPLIEQRDYHMPLGCRVILTLAFLNATRLAQQTASIPQFTLTRQPNFGVLKLLKRHRRPKRDVQTDGINHFTHGDVMKRRVYYEFIDGAQHFTNDSFAYKLTAVNVPPAHGHRHHLAGLGDCRGGVEGRQEHGRARRQKEVRCGGHHVDFAHVEREHVESGGGGGGGSGESLHSPHISNDHLIIIGVAVGVILLGIIIIAAVKCRTHCKKEKKKKKTNTKNGGPAAANHYDGRTDCDQRPDILEQQSRISDYLNDEVPSISSRSGPTSPKLRPSLAGLRRDMSPLRITPSPSRDEEWLEISSTLPSCKVTPLGPHSGHLETNETTLKYPYGMLEPHDIDEWGLYDHSDLRFQRPQNPMLKKNHASKSKISMNQENGSFISIIVRNKSNIVPNPRCDWKLGVIGFANVRVYIAASTDAIYDETFETTRSLKKLLQMVLLLLYVCISLPKTNFSFYLNILTKLYCETRAPMPPSFMKSCTTSTLPATKGDEDKRNNDGHNFTS
uniref:Cadherin domain-containing protein n=1 Tax=Strigamia maritima TaxID=126957 RepID=T1J783_STRMM